MGKIFVIIGVLVASTLAFAQADLPPSSVRANALRAVASEMERLDGEALYVRRSRAIPWNQIVGGLQKEAESATSWPDFMKALFRLDRAYPNLHSSMKPGHESAKYLPNRISFKVGIAAEWLSSDHVRYVVSTVDSDVSYSADNSPRVGDEIVSINGRRMEDWQKDNFEFCKFPLKAQCDFDFPVNFQKELLGWTRQKSLTYTLKRNEASWDIAVELKEANTSIAPALSCKEELNRYDSFKLAYSGNRTCVYESEKYPGTAVLRVMGFYYSADTMEPNEPLDSLEKEIDALYPWWIQHATWQHLVLDVIDNHGGNASTPYLQLLLQHDFQQQFVTFKKTAEIENPTLRDSIFWGSKGLEIWFQNLVSSGLWPKISVGDHAPPVPMFCPDENKNCNEGLFPVRPHPFNGRVSVLVNEWCVSSCDGFVYSIKEKFGTRATFYGHPQAADTAFSRLTINIYLDANSKDGFRLETVPLYDSSSQGAFMSQTVTVTRSTTQDGTILSGTPVPLDEFVPYTLQNSDSWPAEVLNRAL